MSNISVTNINDGDAVTAASVNNQVNTIVNDYNGNVDNSNIKTGANIATAKLATDAGITSGMIGSISYSTSAVSNPYKFRAFLGAGQNTGTPLDTYTIIVFGSETFDTNSNFNSGTGQYFAPVSGFYQFNYTVNITFAGSDTGEVSLFVNGSIASRGQRFAVNTFLAAFSGSELLQLTAGDSVDVRSSASTARAISTGTTLTAFSGFLVSKT